MDGRLAILWLLTSLGDMQVSECETGCLARNDAPERVAVQFADVQFNTASISDELFLSYDAPYRFGPFQPTAAISFTGFDGGWVGAGAKWTTQSLWDNPLFFETSFMPGYHWQGSGPDLGGNLHFRSALTVGYAFENGNTFSITYDHRSNGDRLPVNPGMETLALRYAIALD